MFPGFRWSAFSSIRTESQLLCLHGKMWVKEKRYSGMLYTLYELARKSRKPRNWQKLNENRLGFFQFFALFFLQCVGSLSSLKRKTTWICRDILLSSVLLISIKKWFFNHFDILFWISIKFPQQNINQSETEIGDKKLSVELYVNKFH